MKLNPAALDEEIHAVERAIASDRELLGEAVVGYVEGARADVVNTITSPKFLLAAVGVGFVVGKVLLRGENKQTRRAEDGAPVKKSMLGLLGAGVLSIANAQFGGPVGLARWIAARAYEYKKAAKTAASGITTPASPEAPTSAMGGYDAAMQPSAPLHRTHI